MVMFAFLVNLLLKSFLDQSFPDLSFVVRAVVGEARENRDEDDEHNTPGDDQTVCGGSVAPEEKGHADPEEDDDDEET